MLQIQRYLGYAVYEVFFFSGADGYSLVGLTELNETKLASLQQFHQIERKKIFACW